MDRGPGTHCPQARATRKARESRGFRALLYRTDIYDVTRSPAPKVEAGSSRDLRRMMRQLELDGAICCNSHGGVQHSNHRAGQTPCSRPMRPYQRQRRAVERQVKHEKLAAAMTGSSASRNAAEPATATRQQSRSSHASDPSAAGTSVLAHVLDLRPAAAYQATLAVS